MGQSPGPIFLIRPLPWQVRLHGRSKKINKNERFVGSEGKTAWEFVFIAQGLPLCVCSVSCLLSLLCFIFARLQIITRSISYSGLLQQQYSSPPKFAIRNSAIHLPILSFCYRTMVSKMLSIQS
ncbi:hypothetical protein ABKV19_007178 [Rosa sericea]